MTAYWRAHVSEQWETQRVRLLLGHAESGGMRMLMDDGTWALVDDGVAPPEAAGLVVPTEAVPALLDALRTFLGERGPTEGEVRVLREALDVERARVDRVLAPFGATA